MTLIIYPRKGGILDRWWAKQLKNCPNHDHLAKNWLNFGQMDQRDQKAIDCVNKLAYKRQVQKSAK